MRTCLPLAVISMCLIVRDADPLGRNAGLRLPARLSYIALASTA
jgi:hypothetical protein